LLAHVWFVSLPPSRFIFIKKTPQLLEEFLFKTKSN